MNNDYFGFCFRTMYPATPPIIEATKMPILAWVMYTSLVKASEVIKSDMVKPIEARSPTPNRFRRFIPSGSDATFNLISR